MKNFISNSIFGSVLILGLVSANQYKWKSILPQWNTGQVLFFKWNEYRILDYGKRLKSSKANDKLYLFKIIIYF